MDKSQYSTSESDRSETDNTYCVFLHIVEAVGLIRPHTIGEYGPRDRVVLTAALNGVKFEVDGHSTETSTIFNSNCIWECEMHDLKRMKTDNRPVKLECFMKDCAPDKSASRMVGSLLLPIRGLPMVSNIRTLQINLHWHKLSTLRAEWRQSKPEIFLCLTIVKKSLVESGQLEELLGNKKHPPGTDTLAPSSSETALMLQSQSNVYVQLLEQVGLIQVGNNPDVDCDIITVSLTFKQVKNVRNLLQLEQPVSSHPLKFFFHYDFLGSISHTEITVNPADLYTVNEKVSLSFKSSVPSLRNYFQRIFYMPVNLYYNGVIVANFRFDFGKLMPADGYFEKERNWQHHGTFFFDRMHKLLSPRLEKPSVDFLFTFTLVTLHSRKKHNLEVMSFNDNFMQYSKRLEVDNNSDVDSPHSRVELSKHVQSARIYDTVAGHTMKQQSDYVLVNTRAFESTEDDQCAKIAFVAESMDIRAELLSSRLPKPPASATVGTSMEPLLTYDVGVCTMAVSKESVATETEPMQTEDNADVAGITEELTFKIVQELEEWKTQQMDNFLEQLARKEDQYLAEVKQNWKRQRNVLQARLEAEANGKLEMRMRELQSSRVELTASVKREIEQEYARKFEGLELEIQHLKQDIQTKGSKHDLLQKDMQMSNTRLQEEKTELKERIEDLHKQLLLMEKTHLSTHEIKDVLVDLRKTNERFLELQKSKNHYKDLWSKAAREVDRLKLIALKKKEKSLREKTESNGSGDYERICIEDILSEEQDALRSDRSELDAIKDLLTETCVDEDDL